MNLEHSVSAHWQGGFDEPALERWAADLRSRLRAPEVSLGTVFMTPHLFPSAGQILELLRVHARVPLLIGCSSTGLIQGDSEIENSPGLVAGLYHLPGADLKVARFTGEQVEEADGPAYWHSATGVNPESTNGWLVLADPFHLDCERWLRVWEEAWPGKPILGGLASGDPSQTTTQIYHDGEVFEDGGIALSVGGEVNLAKLISQGCTPIGQTWTITRAEPNLIHEIGNRPAYEVLMETVSDLPPKVQARCRGNLFVGLVMNEYLDDFQRGDFLIRNILGADPASGSLVVGALPREGQTMQFQRRDSDAADEDLVALLEKADEELRDREILGGCLCCCNGRGKRLFGRPGHDAGKIQSRIGPFGLTGFFCNGEIGPVGGKNFLHGYTASLALFTRPKSG